MTFRNQIVSLALGLLLPVAASAQESKDVRIIDPKKTPTPAKPAAIDTEKFQVGVYSGYLSVEDFNTNALKGLSFGYQLTDSVLLLLNHGLSEVDRSTFERREQLNFLSKSQRKLSYTELLGGYKLFTSRSFFGADHKYDSDLYLLAGLGQMDFAGETGSGISVGASYRIVFTDWLVSTLEFKDHIYDTRDVFGLNNSKTTQNIEFSIGFHALF